MGNLFSKKALLRFVMDRNPPKTICPPIISPKRADIQAMWEEEEDDDYSLPNPLTPRRPSQTATHLSDMRETDDEELPETRYEWTDVILGKGELSVVHKATCRNTLRNVAIKRVPPASLNPKRVQRLYKEAAILSKVTHFERERYFVHLQEAFIDHQGGVCLVMDMVEGKEMYELLQRFPRGLPESEARHFLRQIFEAVEDLHQNDLVHLDLKLENIMYNEETQDIKIIDFGFSEESTATDVSTGKSSRKLQTSYCGSLDYSAPEILQHQPFDGKRADVWSLGVLTFVLLTGEFPFEGRRRPQTLENIVRCQFTVPELVSDRARSLIHRMLQRYPDNRSNVSSLLRHAWFTAEHV
jgi:serine/threonine protein kinase